MIIVCEGAETEPGYFRGLRRKYKLPTLTVQVVEGQVAPISVVREARKQKRKLDDERDEVWCVFDLEANAHSPSVIEAINLAKSSGLHLAASNPAFEYWYILHFECTDSPFRDAADAIARLKVHLPHYDHHVAVFRELEARIQVAVENAAQLRRLAVEPWEDLPNPSTTVDQLVIEIENLARQSTECIRA